MNRISILFMALVAFCIAEATYGQAPGGITTGLTAWYKADAGVTVTGGNVTAWANQAVNPLVGNMTPNGTGTVTNVTNNPLPFNFNAYMLYNNSVTMHFIATGTAGTEVMPLNKGSMMAAGTSCGGVTELNVTTASQTSSGCGGPRCAVGMSGSTGTAGANTTSFSGSASITLNTAAPLNTGGVANIFGTRMDATATTTKHENTANGFRNSSNTVTVRGVGQYRLSLGSFPGYFYEVGGKIAESTCFNYQLTPNEFNRLESYYAMKYGVTLGTPASPIDYLSSASIVVWTANTAYPYRVTVIGRDDNGSLLQKQSRSVSAGSRVAMYNDDLAGVFPAMNNNNTSVFAADQSFAAFADNNADTNLTVCAVNGKLKRMQRTWKMQATGAIGNVSIAIDATTFSPNIGSVIYSADPAFPDAGTSIAAMTTVGTRKYAVIPAGNIYFTFASPELTASVDVVNLVCQQPSGGSMTLNTSGGQAPFSYSWNTTPPQTGATVTNVPPGTYTVTITQGNGCTYSVQATLTRDITELAATLSKEDLKCAGDDIGSIAVNIGNGTPAYQYSLNNQSDWQAVNAFDGLAGGFYTVYFKDANGCKGSDTVTIHEPEALSLQLNHRTDDYCELGSNPNGNVEVLLTGGTIPYNVALNGSNIGPSLKLTGLAEGHYLYDVTDANGCQIEDTFSIEHVPCCFAFVPNAFTPNGDGKNDVFEMRTTGRIRLNKMIIYNRYGQIVWGTFNKGEGWNGTQYGKPVDAGTYFYYILYTCDSFTGPKETELKGDITVVR